MDIDSTQNLTASERIRLMKASMQSNSTQNKSINLWQKQIPQQNVNTKKEETIPPQPIIKKVDSVVVDQPKVVQTKTVEPKNIEIVKETKQVNVEEQKAKELPKTQEPPKNEQTNDTKTKIEVTSSIANNPFMLRAGMKIGQKNTQPDQQNKDIYTKNSSEQVKAEQKPNLFLNQFKETIAKANQMTSKPIEAKTVQNPPKILVEKEKQPHQNIINSTQQDTKQSNVDKMTKSDDSSFKKAQTHPVQFGMFGMGPPRPKKDTTIYTPETEEMEIEQLQTMMTRSAPKKSRRQQQTLDIEGEEQNKNQLFLKQQDQILNEND